MHALLVLALGMASTGQAVDAAAELKKLQGEWRAVELEREGKKAPPEVLEQFRVTITGNALLIAKRRTKFTIDPGKTPKEIDITPEEGTQAGKVSSGIYALDEGRLRICIANSPKQGERPQDFTTPPGSGLALLTLERAKQ